MPLFQRNDQFQPGLSFLEESYTYRGQNEYNFLTLRLMPSPSAFSKFGSSILKFFKHAHFFMYTQNHFGILKS